MDVERVKTDPQPLQAPLFNLARELPLQVPLGVCHRSRVAGEVADVAVDLRHAN